MIGGSSGAVGSVASGAAAKATSVWHTELGTMTNERWCLDRHGQGDKSVEGVGGMDGVDLYRYVQKQNEGLCTHNRTR